MTNETCKQHPAFLKAASAGTYMKVQTQKGFYLKLLEPSVSESHTLVNKVCFLLIRMNLSDGMAVLI